MSSVWKFLKRHRGKIILGSAVAAGYVLYQTQIKGILEEEEEKQRVRKEREAEENRIKEYRKHLVEHHAEIQNLCSEQSLLCLDLVGKKVEGLFDVRINTLKEELRDADTLTSEARVEKWEEMKAVCVAKALTSCYATCLVALVARVHLSLLGKHLFDFRGSPMRLDDEKQGAFVAAVDEMQERGVEYLANYIYKITREATGEVALRDSMTASQVLDVVRQVANKVTESVWKSGESSGDEDSDNLFVRLLDGDEESFEEKESSKAVAPMEESLQKLKASVKTVMHSEVFFTALSESSFALIGMVEGYLIEQLPDSASGEDKSRHTTYLAAWLPRLSSSAMVLFEKERSAAVSKELAGVQSVHDLTENIVLRRFGE
mmetsp:Transcript_47705/g.123703  ORF Transcript_47705/g.123703 Transcript_47705/m.123703 type:complete len:375 (-) Transcript_47705:369-1493(-)